MATIGKVDVNETFSKQDLDDIYQYASKRLAQTSSYMPGRSFSQIISSNTVNTHQSNNYCISNQYGCSRPYYGYNRPYLYDCYNRNSTNRTPLGKYSEKKKDTNSEENKNIGTILAVSALLTSFSYMVYSLTGIYSFTKQHYLKMKVTNLSSRQATNFKEYQIIINLKELIDSDQSNNNYRNQKVKILSAMGIFTSSAAYLTAVRDSLHEWIPSFISNNLPTRIPLISDSLNDKVISMFSNENLIKLSKATAIISIGMLVLNKAYDLYQDSYKKNTKSHIRDCSKKVLYSVNDIKHGKGTALFYNAFVSLKSASLFL
jgi:hypothetical protein